MAIKYEIIFTGVKKIVALLQKCLSFTVVWPLERKIKNENLL